MTVRLLLVDLTCSCYLMCCYRQLKHDHTLTCGILAEGSSSRVYPDMQPVLMY